jgi:hypothetical protein
MNTRDTIDTREIIARIEELIEREEEGGLSPAEEQELPSLQKFAAEVEPYCADWIHGETLIRYDYFRDYAQDLAESISVLPTTWPLNCIDWEKAANELRQDYSEADFDGITYYFR